MLEKTFDAAFDEEQFGAFAREWLDGMEYKKDQLSGSHIYDPFSKHIFSYKRIGKYTDPDGRELDVLIVRVRTPEKLDRARTSLRDFVIRHLDKFGKDYALAAFYSPEDGGADWRFSFIKLEYEEYLDDSGKVKTSRRETPAKRYSFLVGTNEKGHTAKRQLLELMLKFYQPTIEQIEAAFSIETVTDEFFEQYKGLYGSLHEYLEHQGPVKKALEAAGQDTVRFTKKLLGQIVFLYFLQKKGWLGAAPGEPIVNGKRQFIQELFKRSQAEGKNFYNDYLKFLFYEALAKERADHYYPRFDCQVPFLNGGLFEAQHDWRSDEIQIPNRFFRNQDTTRSGDVGTGILDVFGRYNFTIKEDEPLEKEVAVDPEMLGKVFENMLDVTERKSKGAFYTPREIVHYMCRESLIHYLDTALNAYDLPLREAGSSQASFFDPNEGRRGQQVFSEGGPRITVPKADLETFIRRGHLFLENDRRVAEAGRETRDYPFKTPASVRAQAKAIDSKLASIRICDPAIGSGAFPVGLLHEIVQARRLLQLFMRKEGRLSPYQLKRHAIENSIYGVDIDASAIDIARLRLWLSMIVDEEVFKGIALPNLDYKIVQGDSLVGFPDNWKSPAFEKVEDLKKRFFKETDYDKKEILKGQIDREIRQRLDSSKKVFGWQVNFDFQLFFSEVWHRNGGFDVVIGNPPYVQIQKFSGLPIQQVWQKQRYDSFTKTGDLYCLFYEKGYRLLREKGVLAFITSNKWMRAGYGKKLRHFFLSRTSIDQLIDFGDSPIFSEATTYTNVLLFERAKNNATTKVWDLSSSYQKAASLNRMLDEKTARTPLFSEEGFIIAPPDMAKIKKCIEKTGTPLKEWDVSIYRGILTGCNEAFIIDGKKKDELISADPKNAEILKPILKGRDIKRCRIDFADLWLIATFPALNLDIDEYPVVRDYLKSFGRKLHQTGEVIGKDEGGEIIKSRKKTGNKWFETQDQIAYYKEFEKEKIIYPETSSSNLFTLDAEGYLLDKTAFLINTNNKYLLALLNSEVACYFFDSIVSKMQGGYFSLSKIYVEKFPAPKISDTEQAIYIDLVDYLLFLAKRKQTLQSAYFEQLIDGLVYELYFPNEIQAAGKHIFPHLANLQPISDEMPEEEKLAIIHREFERLYDPYHPVRNNLETLDSVEEVRIIREALKK